MTISRRKAIQTVGATALAVPLAGLPMQALVKVPDSDDRLVQMWEQHDALMEAYGATAEVAHEARMALPENIRTGPIVTVTTPSVVAGECRSEVDIRRLYGDEVQRHPRFTMEAWSDELKAVNERCRQLEPDITTEEYRQANKKFHRFHDDHNIAISHEIRDHRNGAIAELERERARCDDAWERSGVPELEAKAEALCDEAWGLEDQIAKIEASGVAGLAVQAKLLRKDMELGPRTDGRDLRLADTMIAALDRLAEGGAA